jgi:spermidine/putrescine transport system substrate-binding protein
MRLGSIYSIQVVYETFDSNEAMEAKIRNGGTHYDVAFPSEYTVLFQTF